MEGLHLLTESTGEEASQRLSLYFQGPRRTQQNGKGRLELNNIPTAARAIGDDPLGAQHFSLASEALPLLSQLGLLLPGADRELALGGRTCSGEGHSKAGRGPGLGSVSGQQGTPAFAGGAGGVLQRLALRPQGAPLQCPLTQEREAFQLQGLVGRLLEMG